MSQSTLRRVVTDVRLDSSPATLAAVAIPTALVLGNEILLYVGRTGLALGGHLLTLLACVLAPLVFREEVEIFQAFVLLPAFRLVNLGMPIFVELTLFWYPIIYGPLLPAAVVAVRNQTDVPLTKGLRTALLALPVVLLVSAIGGAIEYSIITPAGLVQSASVVQFTLLAIVMIFFVGLVEELLYRGLLQRTLARHVGLLPALIIANLLFGMMHSAYGEPLELLFAALLGLFYGLVYEFTDNMPLITLLHGTLNTFLFGVYPVYGLPMVVG